MKKTLTLILLAVFAALTFTSCASTSVNREKIKDSRKLTVIATSFPQYDFVRQIAGDCVELRMLILPGAEVHTYEPSPKDIMDISSCDVFVCTGGESDEWAKSILESVDNEKLKVISFMESAKLRREETTDGMEEEQHGHGEEAETEEEYDEHVWTSPKNAELIAADIEKVLSDADPDNKELYSANLESFTSKLEALDESYRSMMSEAKRDTIIVGDRFPFLYLAKEYGIKYFAAFPGCASNTEASASTIAFLSDKAKMENIPVVFRIEFSNGKIADTICEAAGAQTLELHSCNNVSADDFKNGVTYIDLMERNLQNLGKALN